jgi:hypothetical protein
MVDESHVNILAQGVEPWNSWRARNPVTLPDLFGVDLSGRNLSKINLSWAKLRKADLSGADASILRLKRRPLVLDRPWLGMQCADLRLVFPRPDVIERLAG